MTIYIIIITVAVSIFAFNNNDLHYRLRFNPYMAHTENQWYRFFTHAFVHADWMHLAINMFVLYSFGTQVEQYFGFFFGGKAVFFYLLMYAGGILFSSISTYIKYKSEPYYNAVGASGAVSAVVFSSIVLDPMAKLGFLFLPIPMPAFVFGVIYLIYSAYMSKKGNDNIGHDAHFWGALFGVFFTIALEPSLLLRFIHMVTGQTV
jgi:membrane associated rhomboid family serine protease